MLSVASRCGAARAATLRLSSVRAYATSKHVVETTDASYEADVIQSKVPVLVDFYADWCGPCRMLGPVLEKVANDLGGAIKVAKINVDENTEIAAGHNVSGIPHVMFVNNGAVLDKFVGMQAESEVRRFVTANMQKMSS